MPQDILAKTAQSAKSKKRRISLVAVILTIILAIVLILLGERVIFDLNRVANPLIQEVEVDDVDYYISDNYYYVYYFSHL